MAEVIPYRFRLRGGTAAEWAAANPVLLAREPGVESDTRALKIGDGTTPWNSLPYSGRNVDTVLSEAATTAQNKIDALKFGDVKTQVDTLWSERGSGTGGTGTGSYDDTDLRNDFAQGDRDTLAAAKKHTDDSLVGVGTRFEKLEGQPKPVVLSQAAYDGLGTKDANTLYFIRS